jgi:hypothetical protein
MAGREAGGLGLRRNLAYATLVDSGYPKCA